MNFEGEPGCGGGESESHDARAPSLKLPRSKIAQGLVRGKPGAGIQMNADETADQSARSPREGNRVSKDRSRHQAPQSQQRAGQNPADCCPSCRSHLLAIRRNPSSACTSFLLAIQALPAYVRNAVCAPVGHSWESMQTEPKPEDVPLALLFDNALVGIALLRERRFLRLNRQLAELFGYEVSDLVGKTTECLYPDSTGFEDVGRYKYASIKAEGITRFERPMKRRDGSLFWCRLEGRGLEPSEPEQATVWIMSDVTAEKGRRERSLLHAGLFENSAQAIIISDSESRILSVNRAFTRITGYSEFEALGRNPSMLQSGRHDRDFYQNMWASLNETGQWHGEIWNRRKDGSVYPELLQVIAIRAEDGNVRNYVGFFSDLSESKLAEQRLHFLANHDALTRLPKRAALVERLAGRLVETVEGIRIAVIALDLNQFKRINESAGMEIGDRLLVQFAERIARICAAADFAARLEGDDFVVLHEYREGTPPDEHVRAFVAGLSEPYVLDGVAYHLRVSAGVSVAPGDGSGPETLIRYAMIAQNRGRRPNQSTVEFFRRRMNAESVRRLLIESELRTAISQDELVVHYQPQCTVDDDRIVGFEALVRWLHPSRGLSFPNSFIPAAEQLGLIKELNRWVLRHAVCQARDWLERGFSLGRISVNCSAEDLALDSCPKDVGAILSDCGLSAEYLTLEITETMAIGDVHKSATVLGHLRDMGVQIAMDDFGTGYSSLNALRTLPVEYLKLDRSFVQDLPQSAGAFAMVRAVEAMSSALGLPLVAEGVETPAQLAVLRDLGCRYYQGYLRSRPVSAEQVEALFFP